MKKTKNINFSSKSFRRHVFLPLTALLLVALLFSTPFLSLPQGQGATYTIRYTFEMGGTNDSRNPTTYDNSVDTPIFDAYDPVYKFQGWIVTYWANGTQIIKAQRSFVIPAGTTGLVELTAVFDTNIPKYDFIYELDGGTNNPANKLYYAVEKQVFPVKFFAPSKLGYEFSGWTVTYANPNIADITTPTHPFQVEDGTTGVITLRAIWTPLPNIPYKVEHVDAVSGVVLKTDALTGVTGESVVAVPATIDGYTYDAADGRNVKSGVVAGDGSLVLKLYYIASQFDITYVLNGGTNAASNPDKYSIDTLPIPIANATKPGYALNYWQINCSNGTQIQLNPAVGIPAGTTGDVTLAAVWNNSPITYSITYNYNGGVVGTKNPATYNVENRDDIIPDKLSTPVLKGHAFSHWMVLSFESWDIIELDSNGIPIEYGGVEFLGDVLIVAIWDTTPIVYTISYELDGGTNADGNPVSYTIESDFPMEVRKPTKDGYIFLGWTVIYESNGAEAPLPTNGIRGNILDNLTLVANWD